MPDDFTRLLWSWLPLALDREGRGIFNATWVKSKVFPLREDKTPEDVNRAMGWYAKRGMIEIYQVKGREYFYIPTFHEYQGDTRKEANSTLPQPPVKSRSGVGPDQGANRSSTDSDSYSDSYSDSNADADADADANESEAGPAPAPQFTFTEKPEITLYREVTGQTPDISDETRIITDIQEVRRRKHQPPYETLTAYLLDCYTDWCNTERTDGSGRLYSPTNCKWLSWAIAGKWTKPKPNEPATLADAFTQAFAKMGETK